eukprot:scaffold297427_cov30-Tisochrysis_lutea.AAC.2
MTMCSTAMLADVLANPDTMDKNGLQVARILDPMRSEEPLTDMRSRPFTAMISHSVTSYDAAKAICDHGVDVALPKPLRIQTLQVLIDAAC